jgi:hypothetical protein
MKVRRKIGKTVKKKWYWQIVTRVLVFLYGVSVLRIISEPLRFHVNSRFSYTYHSTAKGTEGHALQAPVTILHSFPLSNSTAPPARKIIFPGGSAGSRTLTKSRDSGTMRATKGNSADSLAG